MNTQREETIGFIGLGLMGRAFSRNLIEDGYRLVGTDPVPAAQEEFKALGGAPLSSPKDVAEAADFVFISVPNSKISLECARGTDGYLSANPDEEAENRHRHHHVGPGRHARDGAALRCARV